ncbi:MAG: hypothetical protein ACK56I_31830, partial [bacterium]
MAGPAMERLRTPGPRLGCRPGVRGDGGVAVAGGSGGGGTDGARGGGGGRGGGEGGVQGGVRQVAGMLVPLVVRDLAQGWRRNAEKRANPAAGTGSPRVQSLGSGR